MTNIGLESKIRILPEELTCKKIDYKGIIGKTEKERKIIEKRNKAKRVYFKKENLKIEDIKKPVLLQNILSID